MINIFKKPPKEVTSIHPEYKKLIQKAFSVKQDGKKITFFEFKEIQDMPAKRYERLNEFLEDHNRGMTKEEGLHWAEQTLKELDKNSLEGMTNVRIIQKMMLQSYEIAMDVDIVMRMLSAVFFYKDENLLDYDWDLGDHKIKLFKDHGLSTFFLSSPIRKYLPVTSISSKDMQTLIKQKNVKKALLKELSGMGIFTFVRKEIM